MAAPYINYNSFKMSLVYWDDKNYLFMFAFLKPDMSINNTWGYLRFSFPICKINIGGLLESTPSPAFS